MTDKTLSELDYATLKMLERLLWRFVDEYGPEFSIQDLYNKIADAKESFEEES